MKWLIRILSLLCLVQLLFVPTISAGEEPAKTARAQLEYASSLKLRLRGTSGEERKKRRAEAVTAYRALHHLFPKKTAERTEASFRAGELLRAGGNLRAAAAEFERGVKLGKGTDFGARAGLEVGHLRRRAHRLLEALRAYESVALEAEAPARYRDRACLWAGQVNARLGRTSEARAYFERLARGGRDPFTRIRAFDAWAASLVDEEDLEGAAGVLDLCRNEHHDCALEETRHGERVRRALERMSSVDRLAAAIAARLKLKEAEAEANRRKALPPPPPPRGGSEVKSGHAGQAQIWGKRSSLPGRSGLLRRRP